MGQHVFGDHLQPFHVVKVEALHHDLLHARAGVLADLVDHLLRGAGDDVGGARQQRVEQRPAGEAGELERRVAQAV